jgi:hypothetical protein
MFESVKFFPINVFSQVYVPDCGMGGGLLDWIRLVEWPAQTV